MSEAGSVTSEATGGGMLQHLGALLPRCDAQRLEFGVKTAIAVLIAVGIEFWFNLGMGGSAAITVLVVKAQLLGTTIEKSALRMIGNVIGCCIGMAFLALFDQDRITAAILFTMFSMFCCFHLQRSRFAPGWHWAYDSAGLVLLTHVSSPTGIFTYTAERWLEISIGIVAVTVVSNVLWPTRAGKVFEQQFTGMLANVADSIASARDAVNSSDSPKQPSTAGNLAAGLPALRGTLHTASCDTSRYERFHDSYELLIGGIQLLVGRSTLLANAVSHLTTPTDNPVRKVHSDLVVAALDALKASIDTVVENANRHFEDPATEQHSLDTASVRSAVERLHSSIKTADFSFRDASAMLYVCDTINSMADELDRFADELVKVEDKSNARSKLSAVQQLDCDDTPFWKRVDVRKSLTCGLVIGLGFVAWIMTNWPSGAMAVFWALIVTSKNCTAPYLPPKAMLPGSALGVSVGAVLYFCVLPHLDGFWQLAVVLFPFYTVCGYLILSSNAKTAGMVSLGALIATLTLSLSQQQSYSFDHVVGTGFSVIGGMSLAFIVLTCVWPIVPEKMFISQVKGIFVACGQWLRTLSSETAPNSTSRKVFASTSAKQLGLCRLWGRLINYTRLPPNSHNAVADLTSSIQLTILHLLELEHARVRWTDTSQAESRTRIAQRLDQHFCEVFEKFVRALERAEPAPELPDTQGLLRSLQHEFDKLRDNAGDDESRRAEAREILAMTGHYTALSSTIAACRDRLCRIDWKTLNQNYF